MNDFPLPPPDLSARQAQFSRPRQDAQPPEQLVAAASPSPTPSPAAGDGLDISLHLRYQQSQSPQVNTAIRGFQQAARAAGPLPQKLERLKDLLQEAQQAYARSDDDRSLSELRNAAGELAEQLFRGAARKVVESESIEVPEKRQQLRQLRTEAEQLSWATDQVKADILMELTFAEADLKFGKR